MNAPQTDRFCRTGLPTCHRGSATRSGVMLALCVMVLTATGCRTFFPAPPDDEDSAAIAIAPVDPSPAVSDRIPDALAGLPAREVAFLQDFAHAVESGDWQWVLDRAEESHSEELMGRIGMDEESYLTFLLRMGESFQTRVRRDDAEPGYFSPYDTVRVSFTGQERSELTTTVRGLLFNRSNRTIDFTLTLLSPLQEIKLTGAYY